MFELKKYQHYTGVITPENREECEGIKVDIEYYETEIEAAFAGAAWKMETTREWYHWAEVSEIIL